MNSNDEFTFIEKENKGSEPPMLFDDYHSYTSGKVTDLDVQLVTSLRERYPELTVTTVPSNNCSLLQFAAAGFALAQLDEDAEPVIRWRGFMGPSHRGGSGSVGDSVFYARYNYSWNDENFILYTVVVGYSRLQYVLKEPKGNETPKSNSSAVTKLLATIGAWMIKEEPAIYVYDGYWSRNTKLWQEVSKAKWDDVILDPKMKKALTEVASKFFDGKEIYEEYGVPWKRGLIFHGPVGNGKTISLKALMHTLYDRKPPVVTLYVKSAPYSGDIRMVFQMARAMTPCLLVLEDVDTIVTSSTRSYFFNEVDGLENNDGILMIATTNHLDKLDPGLSKRPSRFDRKYLFPLPDKHERSLYAQYWRNKLKNKKEIDFPSKLCDALADLTDDFSFAYLKEAFVATLLELARNQDDDETDAEVDDDDPFEKYEFYKTFKEQVAILRSEMGTGGSKLSPAPPAHAYEAVPSATIDETIPLLDAMKLQGSAHHKAVANASRFALPRIESDNADARASGSSFSPIPYSFEALPSEKRAKFNSGIWDWGS